MKTVEELKRYRKALEQIVRISPANGEDVAYVIARTALGTDFCDRCGASVHEECNHQGPKISPKCRLCGREATHQEQVSILGGIDWFCDKHGDKQPYCGFRDISEVPYDPNI